MKNNYIKSPLNYTGGKYNLLPQIISLFPEEIDTFVDLFGGGFNVGINVNSNKLIYNDNIKDLSYLFQEFHKTEYEEILNKIDKILEEYNNIETKEDYYKLRKDYNEAKSWDKLFILSCHSFNHMIRFNNKGEFNATSGIGHHKYHLGMKDRVYQLKESLNRKKEVRFYDLDFREFNFKELTNKDFVYIDPPYLITKAEYNRNWKEKDDTDLFKILDDLNERGIKFALSNVTEHKGEKNENLIKWSSKYNLNMLNYNYNNSFFNHSQEKCKNNKTIEVLITNYIK